MVHAAAAELGKTVGILADLQGPKIRTGALAGGGTVNLRGGQQFIITTAKILGDSTRVNTTFRPLPREVKSGDRICSPTASSNSVSKSPWPGSHLPRRQRRHARRA